MCEKLQLVIEEVWSNEDLDALISKYVAFGEWVFATLHVQLDASTFGTTMMRNNAAPDAHDRYVAVIDCRGTKAARRFFTRWHEIAHLLTDATHLALSVRRSTGEASSVERLMDEIAGEIGFYDPIFRLALLDYREPTFDAVKSIRHQFCSHASF